LENSSAYSFIRRRNKKGTLNHLVPPKKPDIFYYELFLVTQIQLYWVKNFLSWLLLSSFQKQKFRNFIIVKTREEI